MSSHDDRYARQDLPRTTGEFRAAPDLSASTAEFKAFAKAYDSEPDQPWTDGSWPAQPAAGQPYGRRSGRTAAMIAAAVVAVAVVITIAVLAVG
ncbi:MAG TPA: hypothetical protein VN840_05255 [Streptosporangiaceae bacterium]|nr:hypothetical protein [Streptosporangiaceae bacterium]